MALAAGVAVAGFAAPSPASRHRRGRYHPRPIELVYYVENLSGDAVEASRADEPVNPASVVKVATSMWALERLGPDFRFETGFFARGTVDAGRGVLDGDLVVQGSGDPDFQLENAFMVAAALNAMGVRDVTGAVIVNRKFWLGWENGSEGTLSDPIKRGLLMATRLRQAFDPRHWTGAIRRAWRDYADRHGLDGAHPPRVAVRKGIGVDGERTGDLLVMHRSEPLAATLRRFNCYSNNDIERVGSDIGPVEELASLVRVRCDAPADSVELETSSGLGTNRVSPRVLVRLLRELRNTCNRVGVRVESVLPVIGCDPGTVERFFPLLNEPPYATAVVGKTGTLTNTDGGIAVLVGFANTAQGELAFCVAAPDSHGRLHQARQAEERWLVDLLARHGGPAPRTCSPPVGTPDQEASVITVSSPLPTPVSGPATVAPAAVAGNN